LQIDVLFSLFSLSTFCMCSELLPEWSPQVVVGCLSVTSLTGRYSCHLAVDTPARRPT
jgi:hypothetical protein